jgi:hypothetical protein
MRVECVGWGHVGHGSTVGASPDRFATQVLWNAHVRGQTGATAILPSQQFSPATRSEYRVRALVRTAYSTTFSATFAEGKVELPGSARFGTGSRGGATVHQNLSIMCSHNRRVANNMWWLAGDDELNVVKTGLLLS